MRFAAPFSPDSDFASFWRVLYGVADQVAQRFADQRRHSHGLLHVAHWLDAQRLLLLLRQRRQVGDHLVDDGADMDRI